jgi:hypothetical protein
MASPDLPEDLASIDALLEAGELDAARAALDEAGTDPAAEVLRIKLLLYEGGTPPPLVMQKLIQVMRMHPDVAGGKELYQEASARAYRDRMSSVSHSHPPPPARPKDPKDHE